LKFTSFESSFNKNILTLVTGNAIAFIIPIILYPVISRIFSPADYALFGLFASIYGVLEIASAGRYDFAVVLPKKNDEAINVVGSGLFFASLYSILTFLLVVFFRTWASIKLKNPFLADWLFLLPPALFLTSISKLGNGWLIRQKQFKAASINKASQKISEISAQMAFGFSHIGNGLIIGDIIGRLFNAGMSLYQGTRAGFNRKALSIPGVKAGLRQYADFPKYNTLPSMLNALASMIPVFIISSHFSTEVSGSFNFSRILLSIPFALIASSISQVMMQQISEKRHAAKSIIHELMTLGSRLGALGLVGALILLVAAPQIFGFLFGAEWRQSGEFTRILIFSNIISFVVSPFSVLLAVLGKIRYSGIWQTFYFSVSCCLWFFNYASIERFLITLVILDVVCYLIYGFLIYVAVKDYEKTLANSNA
jgi:O-antigen/teichoic acid export membrane protein